MSVQIIEVNPRGCCKPEEFVTGGRRVNGASRQPDESWPIVEFTYVYRCDQCGQNWKVKYHPPGSSMNYGAVRGGFTTERVGKTSRRYRKRLAKELLRQGTK